MQILFLTSLAGVKGDHKSQSWLKLCLKATCIRRSLICGRESPRNTKTLAVLLSGLTGKNEMHNR